MIKLYFFLLLILCPMSLISCNKYEVYCSNQTEFLVFDKTQEQNVYFVKVYTTTNKKSIYCVHDAINFVEKDSSFTFSTDSNVSFYSMDGDKVNLQKEDLSELDHFLIFIDEKTYMGEYSNNQIKMKIFSIIHDSNFDEKKFIKLDNESKTSIIYNICR
jgi:hypothetical protein